MNWSRTSTSPLRNTDGSRNGGKEKNDERGAMHYFSIKRTATTVEIIRKHCCGEMGSIFEGKTKSRRNNGTFDSFSI
jgi:hypothetical protein